MNVKNLKKGFTLTELIIVIVIVGILAGVLIPTFINVVNKANRASDLSLVRNLNEALTLDSVENGKHNNMTEALHAAQASGFDVSKISKKAKSNEILWDSENDVFCYLNGTNIEYYPNSVKDDQKIQASEYYKLWKIYSNVDEIPTTNQEYSIYLAGEKTGDEKINATINLDGVGFDIGENEFDGSATINYVDTHANSLTNGRTVVIRTNWGDLEITAPYDTVKHYNELNKLNVTQIAPDSFHAFGFIAEIVSFAEGRFVAESTASFGQSYDQVKNVLTEHGLELDSSVSALETVSGIFEQHVFDQNGVSKLDSQTINTDPSKGVVHEHAEEIDAAVPATCSSTGLTQGSHCTLCGAVLVQQEVVAMLAHTPVIDPAVPATCTQTGLTQGSHCGVCGASITAQLTIQIDTTNGHNWDFVNFELDPSNTFTAINGDQDDAPTALAHYTCSLCNSNATAGASVSLFSTTLADCTNDGKKVYYASISEEDSLDLEFHNTDNSGVGEFTIAALGHDLQQHAAKSATCTAVGWAAYDTCSRCDYSTYQEIPALGHTVVNDAAVAADCTNTGLTAGSHCSVCNTVLTDQTIVPALGHAYGTPSYVWTNDNSSVTATRVCSRDSSHIDSETVNTTPNITQFQSCDNPELTTYTATFTKTAFTTQTRQNVQTKEPLGHEMTPHAAVAATYTNNGNSEYWSCSRCNKFFSDANGATEIANNGWVIPKLEKGYIDYNLTYNNSITTELNKYSSSNYTISIVFDKASNHTDITSTTPIYIYNLYDCSWNNNALTKTESTKNKAYVYTKVDSNVVTFYFLSDADLYLLDASDTSYDSNHKYFFKSFDEYNISNISFNNFIIDEHSNLTDLFRGTQGTTLDISSLISNYTNHLTKMMDVAPFKNLYDLSSASNELKQTLLLYWIFNNDNYENGTHSDLFSDNSVTLPDNFINRDDIDKYNKICELLEGFEQTFNRLHMINHSSTINWSFTLRGVLKQDNSNDLAYYPYGDYSDYLSYFKNLSTKKVLVYKDDQDGEVNIDQNNFILVTYSYSDSEISYSGGQYSNPHFVITDIKYQYYSDAEKAGKTALNQASQTDWKCNIIHNIVGARLLWYYDENYALGGRKIHRIHSFNGNKYNGTLPDINGTIMIDNDPLEFLIGYDKNSDNHEYLYSIKNSVEFKWYYNGKEKTCNVNRFNYYNHCTGIAQYKDTNNKYVIFEIKVGSYYVYALILGANSYYMPIKNSNYVNYDIKYNETLYSGFGINLQDEIEDFVLVNASGSNSSSISPYFNNPPYYCYLISKTKLTSTDIKAKIDLR